MITKIFEKFVAIVIYLFIGVSIGMSICVSTLNKEYLWLNFFMTFGGLLTLVEVNKYYKNKNLKLFGKINITLVGFIGFSCSMLWIVFLMPYSQ